MILQSCECWRCEGLPADSEARQQGEQEECLLELRAQCAALRGVLESRGFDELLAGADRHIAELQAQCAAMKEALRLADEAICRDPRTTTGYGPGSPDIPALGIIRSALAPDAGKALLERLEKAEHERDEATAQLMSLVCRMESRPPPPSGR